MLLIPAYILDPVWMLRSFKKWDKGMDINPEKKKSYTTQYQEAFVKYLENEYRAKHQQMPVNTLNSLPISNPIPCGKDSGSCQSSFDLYDLSSEEEYLSPNNMAESTPAQGNRIARIWTVTQLYLIPPLVAPKNWGHVNPNFNDYNSDPLDESSALWIPDRTDWWCQQIETHSMYANLSNVAHDIFSIIPHGVEVEARFSI
jgi:hypothetical protein